LDSFFLRNKCFYMEKPVWTLREDGRWPFKSYYYFFSTFHHQTAPRFVSWGDLLSTWPTPLLQWRLTVFSVNLFVSTFYLVANCLHQIGICVSFEITWSGRLNLPKIFEIDGKEIAAVDWNTWPFANVTRAVLTKSNQKCGNSRNVPKRNTNIRITAQDQKCKTFLKISKLQRRTLFSPLCYIYEFRLYLTHQVLCDLTIRQATFHQLTFFLDVEADLALIFVL